MASKLTGEDLATFSNFADLESQLVFMAVTVFERQTTYNDANVSAPKNHVSVTPDYGTNTVGIQIALPLKHTAIGLKLQDSIVAPLVGV